MPRRWAIRVRPWSGWSTGRRPHVADRGGRLARRRGETAYRKHKIFYYAVEPFSDNEIADILAAVFQTRETAAAQGRAAQRAVGADQQHLDHQPQRATRCSCWRRRDCCGATRGSGCQIGQKLLAQMFPVVVTPGEAYLTPANILKTAAACDRVMVLLARDSGLLPGSLARDTKPEFDVDPGEAAGRVTTLAVQPDALGGFACLDARTITALADHIVWDMASY